MTTVNDLQVDMQELAKLTAQVAVAQAFRQALSDLGPDGTTSLAAPATDALSLRPVAATEQPTSPIPPPIALPKAALSTQEQMQGWQDVVSEARFAIGMALQGGDMAEEHRSRANVALKAAEAYIAEFGDKALKAAETGKGTPSDEVFRAYQKLATAAELALREAQGDL